MSSFTKAVISFKIIIVRSTEFVNALEQAIFPTLSHKAPQFLCNLTVFSSREDMSQSGSSVPFNKKRNPCPHCGVALSVSEFCKLCTINKATRPANQGRACLLVWMKTIPTTVIVFGFASNGAGYGSRTRLHSLGNIKAGSSIYSPNRKKCSICNSFFYFAIE